MTATPHKTYFIRTFGCQMNEHDSGRMANLLKDSGYEPARSIDSADIVIFNTCTIREKAHHKALSDIGRALVFKNDRGAIVGVCGCVAQQEGDALKLRFGHIDFVFGPDQISKLPQLIAEAKEGRFSSATDFVEDSTSPHFPHNVARGEIKGGHAFVAIAKGCDGACSYCIVPRVRGLLVSRPVRYIVDEIEDLVKRGAKEVTLLGQNVNAYGRDRHGHAEAAFAGLIRIIARETGIERIRFTSPHPRDMDEDVIAAFGEETRLCPHIHLPVQSGSNETLKRMRRGYTREHYIDIIRRLRAARPDISVTTDIIVGFCGETDDDYDRTMELVETLRFDSMFAFRYSTRPETYAAAHMKDDVPHEVKCSRLDDLLELQRGIQLKINSKFVGQTKNALVFKKDEHGPGRLTGRLADNRLIHFAGNESLIGTILPARITHASMNSLQGEILNDHDRS